MKKTIIAILLIMTILFAAACSMAPSVSSPSASPTPTATPAGFNSSPDSTQKPAEPTPSAAPTTSKSSLYDPSIFVIEASGEWQQELAPGYNANNECEIYLQKIDPNDNRAVAGSYQGIFWMNTKLDASEYLNDLLKDSPISASFDAGGEAIADNLAISLNTTDDKAWTDYNIPDENGNPLPLTQDTPVGKGSFVAVAKSVYLQAHAQGAQGESADYSDAKDGELIDVNYVIHVEPDDKESGSQRKVVINLSGDGFNVTLNGTMKRLPGYPEDVSSYLNSKEYQDSAWRHISE